MTDAEKIKKFELIQERLWVIAKRGTMMESTLAASLIRLFEIPSPNGEDPEGA